MYEIRPITQALKLDIEKSTQLYRPVEPTGKLSHIHDPPPGRVISTLPVKGISLLPALEESTAKPCVKPPVEHQIIPEPNRPIHSQVYHNELHTHPTKGRNSGWRRIRNSVIIVVRLSDIYPLDGIASINQTTYHTTWAVQSNIDPITHRMWLASTSKDPSQGMHFTFNPPPLPFEQSAIMLLK